MLLPVGAQEASKFWQPARCKALICNPRVFAKQRLSKNFALAWFPQPNAGLGERSFFTGRRMTCFKLAGLAFT